MSRYLPAILNCIGDNFIGYPGCETEAPDSALYLNDIPGITQVLAAKSVSEDDVTGRALFEKVYREGIGRASRDFFREVAKRGWQLRSELDHQVIGSFKDTDTITGGEDHQITVSRCDSLYSYQVIEYIRFFVTAGAENPGLLTFTITDGPTTTEFTIHPQPGVNVLRIDYMSQTDEVVISTDWTIQDGEDEPTALTVKDTTNCSCMHTGSCGCTACYVQSVNCQFEVESETASLNGFIVMVSCVADAAFVFCKYKYDLADAIRHAMAIEFLVNLVQSRRGNPWTSTESKDLAREQLAILLGGVDEEGRKFKGEYPDIMVSAVDIIEPQMQQFGIFECIKARLVTSLP